MVEADVDSRPILTVTGITGFLGSNVGLAALQDGNYRVRGTVRSKNNADKIDPIRKAYGDIFNQLELVEADLTNADSLMKAIQGSTYVLHVASPFTIDTPRDENELIRPAVDGTLGVLRACQAAGVRRVSITSSVAAIRHNDPVSAPDVWDESHWADTTLNSLSAYEKSKVMAERAAWKFVEEMPENERIQLTTVNPGLILGRTMIKGEFASAKIMNMFLNDSIPGGVPLIKMAAVDVEDVAKAHMQCIKLDEAQGKRYVLVGTSAWMRDLAMILSNNYAQYGYRVPTNEAKYCLIKFVGFFRDDAKQIAKMWGKEYNLDNTRSKEILGIEYRPLEQSITTMVEGMIQMGTAVDKINKGKK